MKPFQIGTLILVFSVNMSSLVFASVEFKQEPLKISMRDIYRVMNSAPTESRIESNNPRLGDFHLFVNTATWCSKCNLIQNALNDFAQRYSKKVSVIFVYDNSGQNTQALKAQAESTSVYEFFDESRALYYLFKEHETKRDQFKPSFVFVNPNGKALFNGFLSEDLKELESFALEMTKTK